MKDIKSTNTFSIIFWFIVYLILQIVCLEFPLFWDSIFYSGYMPLWYYETNISKPFLPDQSGAFPFHAMYLAFWWKLLGKSLLVSRIAMLPILIGNLWQIKRLANFFIPQKNLALGIAILLAEPCLMTQSILVSTDFTLLFFYLVCVNSILNNERGWLILGSIGLALIHIRGTMALSSILLIDTIIKLKKVDWAMKKFPYQSLLNWIPVGILVMGWEYFQYLEKGWWIQGPDSGRPYSSITERLKNFVVIGRLLLDNGRIVIWLSLVILSKSLLKNIKSDPKLNALVILFLCTLIPIALITSNFTFLGHRYYLYCYLFASLLVIYLISNYSRTQTRNLAFICIGAILISGNFWVYPTKISKGWDSMLAHLPYHGLHREMMQYLKYKNLNISDIGTGFPNFRPLYQSTLDDSERSGFHEFDPEKDKYFLYSNIFNPNDKILEEIKNGWISLKTLKKGQVEMVLYQKIR